MSKYRQNLPQLNGHPFLTDGGLETTLIFHDGLALPEFAAFDLLKNTSGRQALRSYFHAYTAIAQRHQVGIILESPTWRSNPDWGQKIGYDMENLQMMNREAIALLADVRAETETPHTPVVISGCIGPRDDGYNPTAMMRVAEAQAYHAHQINTFADTQADLVAAITMTYVEEAIGIVLAAQAAKMPVVVSFTVETDGRLPSGQPLAAAIQQVDAVTNKGPIYYMINCAHPTHFEHVLNTGETWQNRIQGLRANASCMSHAELDEAETLDDGNPAELAAQYQTLRAEKLTRLNVFGGCCGTDHRHIAAMSETLLRLN